MISTYNLNLRKIILFSLLASIVLGYILAIPYFVEIVDVYYVTEQHIPEYFKLTVVIKLKNNSPLDVTVGGMLILHCTLMDGSRRDTTYYLDRRTIKPYDLETLEAIILFTFTTPENPEAIYAYSIDVTIMVEGLLSSRTIDIKSIYSIGDV